MDHGRRESSRLSRRILHKGAGLIYGLHPHHIDHLAPLCSLLEIPLICSELDHERIIQKFYPSLSTHCYNPLEIAATVAEKFPILFSSLPKALIELLFFVPTRLLGEKILSIWCPHGNSDKGHLFNSMHHIKDEEFALIYGKRMYDHFQKERAFVDSLTYWFVGNYRLCFYKKMQKVQEELFQNEIGSKLIPKSINVLYAPTWEDSESSSSVKCVLPWLLKNLPSEFNLIIKLHPNTIHAQEPWLQEILCKYEEYPNIIFLKDFPLIYALLEHVDVYLGDLSSIGYDFLYFDRPMFFFSPPDHPRRQANSLGLFHCGQVLAPADFPHIYSIIENKRASSQKNYAQARTTIYHQTFSDPPSWDDLINQIDQILFDTWQEK